MVAGRGVRWVVLLLLLSMSGGSGGRPTAGAAKRLTDGRQQAAALVGVHPTKNRRHATPAACGTSTTTSTSTGGPGGTGAGVVASAAATEQVDDAGEGATGGACGFLIRPASVLILVAILEEREI